MRRFDEIVKAHGTTAGYYGHASVGCLHIRPLVNLKTAAGGGKHGLHRLRHSGPGGGVRGPPSAGSTATAS